MQTYAVAYIGNFRPAHSTENDVRDALEQLGHQVIKIQEDSPDALTYLATEAKADVVLWTRTWSIPQVQEAVLQVKDRGLPVVGFHLDRWWGLAREHQVRDEPFFQLCDLMVTADGGSHAKWSDVGVNHLWMPPAVSNRAQIGKQQTQFQRPLGFVGSWRSYHSEWQYRRQLVEFLHETYGRKFRAWPRANQQIRGRDLADLYASVDIVVGDSCLAGNVSRYWSDRIPETLGRGGFLIHPEVDGMDEQGFVDGETLVTYKLEEGNFSELQQKIDWWLQSKDRKTIAANGFKLVHEKHTYVNRMSDLIAHCKKNGML